MPPKDDTPALVELRKAGRRFARAQAARDKARDDLFAAIRAADATDGVTRAVIIETAGVARQTVYEALRPATAPTPTPDGSTPEELPT